MVGKTVHHYQFLEKLGANTPNNPPRQLTSLAEPGAQSPAANR